MKVIAVLPIKTPLHKLLYLLVHSGVNRLKKNTILETVLKIGYLNIINPIVLLGSGRGWLKYITQGLKSTLKIVLEQNYKLKLEIK